MAPSDRPQRPDGLEGLSDALDGLLKAPWTYNFFQAVHLLERAVLAERAAAGLPPTDPLGAGTDPEEEPLRFSSSDAQAFPASALRRVLYPLGGGQPQVEVNFMGLAGPRGPMPHVYTQLLQDRRRMGDGGLKAFLDIFNHRVISLLYRVKQQHRPDLHAGPMETQPLARHLLAFAGLGDPQTRHAFDEALVDHDGVTARNLIGFAGAMWSRARSMHGLERMLGHHFGHPFTGEQLTGSWLRLADDQRSRLTARTDGGAQNRLGLTAVAGRSVWDPQSAFTLKTGPLDWDAFNAFLPGGRSLASLVKLTRVYTRNAFDMSLEVSVKPSAVVVRRPTLSSRRPGPRLGWTSWLLSTPTPEVDWGMTEGEAIQAAKESQQALTPDRLKVRISATQAVPLDGAPPITPSQPLSQPLSPAPGPTASE